MAKRLSNFMLKENSQLRKDIDSIYEQSLQNPNLKKAIDCSLSRKPEDVALKTEELQKPEIKRILASVIDLFTGKFHDYSNDFKTGILQKWTINLFKDFTKLGNDAQLRKLKNIKNPTPEIKQRIELLEEILKKEKDNSTPTMTLTIMGGTFLGMTILMAPLQIFNSWLANLQKKAGYIGVMKTTQKLDNVKYFASKQEESLQEKAIPQTANAQNYANFLNNRSPVYSKFLSF